MSASPSLPSTSLHSYASPTPGEDEDIVAREESIYHERDKARLRRRRAVRAELMALREELFSGEWDALVVASTYEPGSILETLGKYLAGSAPAVVYSAHPNVSKC